jgi:tRNA(adenine34) deaminase
MRIALEEAKKAGEEGEVPVGAVLVFENQVIARGHNRPIALHDPTGHAEILALRFVAAKAENYRIPEATLYVTLEPCIMCSGALIQARVKRLVFGADDPKGGGVKSLYSILSDERLNHRLEIRGGVFQEECRNVLVRFFQAKRKGIFTTEATESTEHYRSLKEKGGK